MSCEEYIVLISGRMDGANRTEEEALLDEHLASCPHCREILAQMEANDANLRNSQMIPPASIVPNVMKKIKAEKQAKSKRSLRYTLSGLATAAVLFLVVLGAVRMPSFKSDEPQQINYYEPTLAPAVPMESVSDVEKRNLPIPTVCAPEEVMQDEDVIPTGACGTAETETYPTVFLYFASEEDIPDFAPLSPSEALELMPEDAAHFFETGEHHPIALSLLTTGELEALSYTSRYDFPTGSDAETYIVVFCTEA